MRGEGRRRRRVHLWCEAQLPRERGGRQPPAPVFCETREVRRLERGRYVLTRCVMYLSCLRVTHSALAAMSTL
eukprot:3528534-Pleurochrysis_carterae.AAC.1